uniref:Putative secreted peptide n=1 Tax=Anopheles braziliensis TaxID=58242 RepID=A0A2M3ZRK9_9DIPT
MTAFVYCSLWSTVCGASCGYTWPPPNEWQDPSSLTAASVSCTITMEVKMVSTSQQQVAAAKGRLLAVFILSVSHSLLFKRHAYSSNALSRTEVDRRVRGVRGVLMVRAD